MEQKQKVVSVETLLYSKRKSQEQGADDLEKIIGGLAAQCSLNAQAIDDLNKRLIALEPLKETENKG